MNDKKSKQKDQKLSSFFKPLTYSKSATTTQRVVSNHVQATLVKSKVLTVSTNTPQKKKKSKSVNIPVKSNESMNDLSKSSFIDLDIQSSVRLDLHLNNQANYSAPSNQSSEFENEFFSQKLSTSVMLGSTATLETDELFVR